MAEQVLYICPGIDDISCRTHYCYMREGVVKIPDDYVRKETGKPVKTWCSHLRREVEVYVYEQRK